MISQKLKDTLRGILIATATWMIVIPLRNYLVDVSPIKNPWMIGVGILIFVIFWDNR